MCVADSSMEIPVRKSAVTASRRVDLQRRHLKCMVLSRTDVALLLGPVPMRLCLQPVLATNLLNKPPRERTKDDVRVLALVWSASWYGVMEMGLCVCCCCAGVLDSAVHGDVPVFLQHAAFLHDGSYVRVVL